VITAGQRASWTFAVARSLLLALLPLAVAGCFLMSRAPQRPEPTLRGPVPYVETCVTCHAEPTIAHYATAGIHCGQCHTPDPNFSPSAADHPKFSQPVADGKCGGCHQAEYQQTLASKHFASRLQRSLNSDAAARASLRRDGFTAPDGNARHFVGDSSSGELGGRLCLACHFDEHRLGLGAVQRANFCVGCHGDRQQHFSDGSPDMQNRCVTCHVRAGATVFGQVVNTHRFARPGT